MRRSIQLVLLAALTVAFLTWSSRGEKPAAAVPAPSKKKAKAEKTVELPPPPAIVGEVVFEEPRPHDGQRNLFAYVSAPVAPMVVRQEPVVTAPIVVARPEPPAPVAPVVETPRFSYRYIGRFGPDGNPVAAFVRDGEVVTAQRGDRVGEFVVRDIGIESVDVAGDAGTVRVALGGGAS